MLAFGFDEEVSGREARSFLDLSYYGLTLFQGAGHLSEALRSAFGENAFSFIIDEGGVFLLDLVFSVDR